MKIQLPPDVPAGLLAEAQKSGLSLEAYAEKVLRERVSEGLSEMSGHALVRSRTAGQRIRELRRGLTLGGLSIRELVGEGHE